MNIDYIDNTTLDILSTRLKNSVSQLDILKWLNNFEKSELKFAIDILQNLTVFTTFEIEEILNEGLNTIFPTIENEEILVIHPVGNFGKSGSMVSYFLQKTDYHKSNKVKIQFSPDLNTFSFKEGKNYKLLLIDDFVGSGNTIDKYFTKDVLPHSGNFMSINFIGIAGMNSGVKKITPHFSSIHIPNSNIYKKAFSSEASYFGYRKQEKHREFAYKYGILLTGATNKKKSKLKFKNALGYNNSQALVSFSYGSPNNTLPIIWANKNDWFPLLPRFFPNKIDKARKFRKGISSELSILKEFGSENIRENFFSLEVIRGRKTFTSANKIDFTLYAIIKLTRAGVNPNNICQKLGILSKDYEDILDLGKEREIFTNGNNLSLYGLELFQDAKKCIERNKKNLEYETKDIFAVREINYKPKIFNGKS